MSQPVDVPSRIRLLHVDDEEFQLDYVKNFLNMFDPSIDIVSISSPIKALKILEKEYFDCVVTDFRMPEMNGIELSKKIRINKSLPIVLYTGQGSEEVAESAFRVGVNDYIKKEMDPLHYHILAKKIRGAVEKKRIEDLYIRVVEDSREAIAIVINGIIMYANTALVELLGEKKVLDIIGRKFLDFLQPRDRDDMEKILADFEIENQAKYYPAGLRRRDGNKIPSEISVSIINYGGQKAVLNFVRDISQRKKLEFEIRSSEARFRTLVNMNPDGIALLNNNGKVIWINPMFSKILGYPEQEILGTSLFSVGTIQTSQYLKNMEIFRSLNQGIQVPTYEFQWVRKDKERVRGEAHFSLINSETGSPEIMVITRDVTQQIKIKEELEGYSKKLEKLVQEKTAILVDSEKMIAAGKLASLLANDIMEPLMEIKNAVNNMRKSSEDKKAGLETINNALLTSIAMLDDLRSKTKNNPIVLTYMNINTLVRDSIKEFPIPPKVNIELDVNDVEVNVDVQQVKRVFTNLIQNSIDAMNGEGTLKITSNISDEGLIIKVEDNGCGIKSEDVQMLFTPFYTTKKEGLGLGLTFCKKIIESHNGQIIINSKSNKGTIIKIQLPIVNNKNNVIVKTQVIR
jgi:PAS domain S-box-containing protein